MWHFDLRGAGIQQNDNWQKTPTYSDTRAGRKATNLGADSRAE